MKITILEMDGCPKCFQVAETIERIERIRDIKVEHINSKTDKGQELIDEYELLYAPTLIFDDGLLIMEKGLTEQNILRYIDSFMDEEISELEDELLEKKKIRLTGKYKEKRYIP
jgi:hypothetical protein